MKLTVTFIGDHSVGIFDHSFEVECPFEKNDVDSAELEFFRNSIAELYREFGDSKIHVEYDFEQRMAYLEEIKYDERDYDNEAKQYQDDVRESDSPTPYDP